MYSLQNKTIHVLNINYSKLTMIGFDKPLKRPITLKRFEEILKSPAGMNRKISPVLEYSMNYSILKSLIKHKYLESC